VHRSACLDYVQAVSHEINARYRHPPSWMTTTANATAGNRSTSKKQHMIPPAIPPPTAPVDVGHVSVVICCAALTLPVC
jgi:hypothetical protein